LLEKIGLQVKEIYLYDVCSFRDTSQWNEFRVLFSNNKVDGVIFTSVSSVNAFFEIMLMDCDKKTLLENLQKIKVVAIGPFTADELKKFDLTPTVADIHTVAGAFETIKNCFN
ncbi:MAG: uroporphyrinogen-III synthase, partial [Thermoproteota archaeon]